MIHWSQVWKVDLAPTAGCEIQKTGPCVVICRDYIGALPLRVVVPTTEWKERFAGKPWIVKLIPDDHNGLSKP